MILFEYLKLTAPRITLMVMMTGFIGVWTGSRGAAPPSLILWSLLGIGLASAGASVFNNYYDRDIDRLMKRTCHRPLPSGKLHPNHALLFGIVLSIAAFVLLTAFVNFTSAMLAVFAIFIYAYLYTVVLKRRSPMATEIGGISGALPPVIGWVAARGTFSMEALLLFAMMFLWQPPHFWSLAMRHRKDYLLAQVPTMPVVMSEKKTHIRSFMYILLLVTVSVMPYVTGMTGGLHLVTSLLLGGTFLLLSLVNVFSKKARDKQLFYFSIIYLSLNFIVMTINIQV